MRIAYGIAFVVIVAFLLGVAIPADVSWPLRLGLVAACAMLAVMCLWVTVGPSARSPMVLRIVGLAVGGVTFGLTAAGFGVFDPPRPELVPPRETPSISNTSSVLQSSGYRDVSVTYPKKASGTVLVRYAAAPQLDQPGVASDIAGIVWTHEGVRFRTLTIEAGGTSASFSYEEMAVQFPPRPGGLDSLTIAHVEALGSVRLSLFEGFDDIGRDATHMASLFGAGLLALISLVVATWTAFRRARPLGGVLASA